MFDRRHIIIFIGAALGPLGGNAVITILTELQKSFNVDATTAAMSVTFFMIPFAIFQLFSGPISDIYDRNKTIFAGFLLYAIGSLICAISPNIGIFLGSRVLQGFGFALISPVSVAILGDITPYTERGLAMGWFGTAITTGIATGPLLGGFLAPIWPWAFVLFFILSLIIGISFWIIFKNQKYDIKKGSFQDILPQLKMGLSNKNVFLISISGFFIFFSYIGVITFLTNALEDSPFKFSTSMVGIIIASSGFSGIVASPFAGRAVDKFGRIGTTIFGMVISMAALFLLVLGSSFFMFILLFILLGCGNAIIWAALTTLSVEVLPPNARGTSSSIFNFARFFGYAIAPIILGYIFGLYGITPLYVIGGLLVLVSIPIIKLLKLKPEPSQNNR
jgi:MFS family permease